MINVKWYVEYKRTSYGCAWIKAKTMKEAQRKFMKGEYEEEDEETEYDWADYEIKAEVD